MNFHKFCISNVLPFLLVPPTAYAKVPSLKEKCVLPSVLFTRDAVAPCNHLANPEIAGKQGISPDWKDSNCIEKSVPNPPFSDEYIADSNLTYHSNTLVQRNTFFFYCSCITSLIGKNSILCGSQNSPNDWIWNLCLLSHTPRDRWPTSTATVAGRSGAMPGALQYSTWQVAVS